MRVVFAAKEHLPSPGGAQLTTHWLARELARRGHDVSVLAQCPPERGPGHDERWGYPTIHSAEPAADLLRKPAPDCVVVGGYGRKTTDLTADLLEASAGLRRLLYLHDEYAVPFAARAAGAPVAAVSRYLAEAVERTGVPCAVVPPIVDASEYRVDTSRRVALFVNPVDVKGVDLALALAAARPDVPFAFTRCWEIDDHNLARLRERVGELGNVELRDAVSTPAEIYGDARVLLVPSVYPEAWGRVASEAQASAIPVLAAAVGGLSEAVGDGGRLIDPGAGVAEWAGALGEMWDDEAGYERWSARAAARARRGELSSAAVGDSFATLLGEAVRPAAA